ncbi:MAG TPA: ABC transporter permease [Methylomirabilota bacterium]|nr:ABC transporter permease [Methylomirabilota bacterium]
MTVFVGLLRKELLTFITNRTIVVLVGLPAIVAILFNLAFTNERPIATVAVLLPADSALADRARRELDAYQTLRIALVTDDLAAATAAATRGRVSDVIDARGLTTSGDRIVGRIALVMDELRPVSAQVVQATVNDWAARLSGTRPSVTVDLSVVRGVSPRQATIPLWLVTLTLVIAISTVPLSLVEEREQKTLRALLVSPAPRAMLLAAKGLVGAVTILVMSGLVVAFNGVALEDPILFATALLCGALGFVPVGLALGAFSPTQTSAGPFAALLLVALSLPVALSQTEGSAISSVASLLPSGALAAAVRGATISNVGVVEFIPQLAYLLVIGVVSSVVAVWAIGRESVMIT